MCDQLLLGASIDYRVYRVTANMTATWILINLNVYLQFEGFLRPFLLRRESSEKKV